MSPFNTTCVPDAHAGYRRDLDSPACLVSGGTYNLKDRSSRSYLWRHTLHPHLPCGPRQPDVRARACVCGICVYVEARGQQQLSSFITPLLIFKIQSLTEAGTHWFSCPGCAVPRTCLSLSSIAGVSDMHHHIGLFIWLLGSLTQILLLVEQALCSLNHLPRPALTC